jgi:predicted NBD/HSP70 family sugar kinase
VANTLVSESLERTVLAVGLVAPWEEIVHDERDLAEALAVRTGLEVSTANHVAAVAAAEYLGQRRHGVGCTAYVYVRETAGMALANDMVDRTEISRVANLTHLPTRSDVACSCGQIGCFAATAGDDALARRAVEQGIVDRPEIEQVLAVARSGDVAADGLLRERARVLGAATAVLRDMIAPDSVVLVGQAFTGYPPAIPDIAEAFREATTLPPLELSFTRFGTGVQAAAAGTVALSSFYEDPLGLLERDLDSASC